MKKIAFLGGGKIGRAMLSHVQEKKNAEVAFVYDPFLKEETVCGVKVVSEIDRAMFEGLDLVVECATAEVVKANLEDIFLELTDNARQGAPASDAGTDAGCGESEEAEQ